MALFWKLRPQSGELLNLDCLRFVAAAGIVAYHSLEFYLPSADREALTAQTRGLTLFVDLFFVISGFVIAHGYHGKVDTLAGYGIFMQRRIGRLMPLHLLTLAVSIVVFGAVMALGKGGDHFPSFEPRCIVQTALLLHALVPCGNGISFNGISWSIGAEMSMYLLFPLLAWAGSRMKYTLAVATLAVVVAATLAHWMQGGVWERLWPVFRALPSFMFGVSLFYWRAPLRRLPHPALALAVSLPLLVAAMVGGLPDIVSLALVYVVAGSAVAADVQQAVAPLVRRIGPLGQLTYSIYMWHSILLMVFMNAIGNKLLHAGPGLMLAIGAICYATILLVSYVSLVLIETPSRRWIGDLKLFPVSLRTIEGRRAS